MDERAHQSGALRRSSESFNRCSSSSCRTAANTSVGAPSLSRRSIVSSAATICCSWMALICAAGKARVMASSKVAVAMVYGVALLSISIPFIEVAHG